MNLPRPASDSWGEWLDILTPAQLRAVHAWRRESYNALLGPKTCWYLLCGRNDPAERQRREALSAEYFRQKSERDEAIRARIAVSRDSGAILGGSAQDQALALQNDGEGPQIAREAA